VTLDDFDADLAGRWNGTVPESCHRGLELFGQQVSRLKEPGYRESIARHGILVVEGFNDVIGLDNLGIPAIAIMSNRITEMQGDKIARWAKQLANGKVSLLLDCEETGDDGAKEALWLFSDRGLDVRLGWSQALHGGAFKGRQPENLRVGYRRSTHTWQSLNGVTGKLRPNS